MTPTSKSFDPQGKRALFETPVSAPRDSIRSGKPRDGKEALYSTGPAERGTVVVQCSSCQARTRINLTDLAMRMATLSAWLPARRHPHWLRCPACERRTWCRIDWTR